MTNLLMIVLSFIAVVQSTCIANGGMYSTSTNSCFKLDTTTMTWNAAHTTCASRAPVGFRGRLAQAKTKAAWHLLRYLAYDAIWIALKTPVPNSQNVKKWLWYENATTPTGCFSATFQPLEITLSTANADCGYFQMASLGVRDQSCSSSTFSGIVCEFLTGIYSRR